MPEVINVKNLSKNEINDVGKKAAEVLKKGGIIIFPTETVYGIGADIENKQAIEKIYKIKKRDARKPFSYHIGDLSHINAKEIPEKYQAVIKHFLPGPLTLIYYSPSLNSKVGVRYPKCPVFLSIAKNLGRALAGTSVNISTEKSVFCIEDVNKEILSQVDLVIDAGFTEYKTDSTILDISTDELKILREGPVSRAEIERIIVHGR